jgi:hypothetical protein
LVTYAAPLKLKWTEHSSRLLILLEVGQSEVVFTVRQLHRFDTPEPLTTEIDWRVQTKMWGRIKECQ